MTNKQIQQILKRKKDPRFTKYIQRGRNIKENHYYDSTGKLIGIICKTYNIITKAEIYIEI